MSRKRWTPEEWAKVLKSGREIAIHEPSQTRKERWALAQDVLPPRRRRPLFGKFITELEKKMRALPDTIPERTPELHKPHPELPTPSAPVKPEPDNANMYFFEREDGKRLALDGSFTVAELTRMGIQLIITDPKTVFHPKG